MYKSQNEPVWKYIIAWIVMGMLHKIVGSLVEMFYSPESYSTMEEALSILGTAAVVDPILLCVSTVGIFYLVYFVFFENLDAKKVLPWLYVLGAFSVFASVGNTLNQLDPIEDLLPEGFFQTYVISNLVAFVVALFVIRSLVFKRVVTKTS